MTPRQRDLVQSTWDYVTPLSDVAVELFHAELFRRDPELRVFLEARLPAQKRVLVPGLAILVQNLADPDALAAAARQLGRLQSVQDLRHADPAALRAAFLHALRELLGPLCNAETEQAWTAACAGFAQTLRVAPLAARAA